MVAGFPRFPPLAGDRQARPPYEAPERFARKGCVIQACPACQGQPVKLPTEHARRLAVIREIAGLWCEDLESLAYEINELEACWNGELS